MTDDLEYDLSPPESGDDEDMTEDMVASWEQVESSSSVSAASVVEIKSTQAPLRKSPPSSAPAVLSQYIHRFRHAPAMSREARVLPNPPLFTLCKNISSYTLGWILPIKSQKELI